MNGDHAGEDGNMMSEELELWHCNSVESALDGNILYAPVQYFTDKNGTNCVIDEG